LIVKSLEGRGLAAKLDTRDLVFGEKWQAQLKDFIRQADAIVYIVSPRSIASKWCRWEVAQVALQSKRLVPVVHIPVPPEQLPPQIGDVHLLPFAPNLDFAAWADRLAEVLLEDRGWLQEHTRLTELAYTWAAEHESGDHLLRGKALRGAEDWMARRPSGAPAPSQAHLDFIAASQVAAKRRARRWAGGLAVAAVMFAGAAGVAIWQREQARHHLQESLRTESHFRAEQAVRAVNAGDAVTGMLLALEALPDQQAEDGLQRTRPYVPAAEQALYRAWQAQRERAVFYGTHRPRFERRLLARRFARANRVS
jgi:TIR domain